VEVPANLESLFSSYENGRRHPSLDDLLDVLQQMIQEYPQSYIILDAIDECKDRVELTGILEQMIKWQPDKLHLLVTSRKERKIQISLESLIEDQNIICLQSRLVDDDIQKYVRKRLFEDESLRHWQKDFQIFDMKLSLR
jgi:ATP/maltotriose-dependent transcriptional regulator MalT